MTMNPLSRPSTIPSAGTTRRLTPTRALAWLLNLATRMLACSLNMPEPLVHNTGIFVFVHVQAVETSVGRTLCPTRLWRYFQNWRRQSAR
jgi:hypothetical protein